MGIFSRNKERDELVAVFHIGSSSICGSLFYMRSSGVPKIVFSFREAISIQKKIDTEHFLAQTIKALDKVASKIATSQFGAPERMFCVLSSPWYISQNRIIKMEKNTPFIFNAKLADSLIEKEIKLFEDEHLSKYIEIGQKVRPIELKNIKTVLNGYEVLDPCDQKAKEVEMTLFISMSGEEILSKIEDVVFKHFHTREIKFSSFVIASFTVVRDMYLHQEDFLLVDIGGEITDISMVKKNLIHASVSYPMGHNYIVRHMAESMSSSLAEAKSLFSLYKDGHSDEKTNQKLSSIIDNLKNEWLKNFQSSLANLSNDISIPATIFITIDSDYSDFFAEIIKTEQFNQYTLTESKFQIIFLNAEVLHGVSLFENTTIRDTFLIIDAVYINRFLK